MKKLLVLLVVLALAGCSLTSQIIGTWTVQSSQLGETPGTSYGFNTDGTVVYDYSSSAFVTGTYSMSGDHLVMTFLGVVRTYVCDINGNTMTWGMPSGYPSYDSGFQTVLTK